MVTKARKITTKRYAGPLLLTLGLVTASVGTAWACTTSPTITSSERSGQAGTMVTIEGSFIPVGKSFQGTPAAGPVSLHWDSMQGPEIGRGSPGDFGPDNGPNLSVPVTIPAEAGPGIYYLVAVQRDLSGAVIGKAAGTFEVTAAARQSVSQATRGGPSGAAADLWSGFTSAGPGDSGAPFAPDETPVPMAFGLALLAAGILGVGLGGVAVVRRSSRSNGYTAAGR